MLKGAKQDIVNDTTPKNEPFSKAEQNLMKFFGSPIKDFPRPSGSSAKDVIDVCEDSPKVIDEPDAIEVDRVDSKSASLETSSASNDAAAAPPLVQEQSLANVDNGRTVVASEQAIFALAQRGDFDNPLFLKFFEETQITDALIMGLERAMETIYDGAKERRMATLSIIGGGEPSDDHAQLRHQTPGIQSNESLGRRSLPNTVVPSIVFGPAIRSVPQEGNTRWGLLQKSWASRCCRVPIGMGSRETEICEAGA